MDDLEKELFSCYSGIGFARNFFDQQEKVTKYDLIPVIHDLINQCDGIIKKDGMYSFELKIVKIK